MKGAGAAKKPLLTNTLTLTRRAAIMMLSRRRLFPSRNESIFSCTVMKTVGHVGFRPLLSGRSAECGTRGIVPSASLRTIVRSISARTASRDGIRPAETELKSWVQSGQGAVSKFARLSRSCERGGWIQ